MKKLLILTIIIFCIILVFLEFSLNKSCTSAKNNKTPGSYPGGPMYVPAAPPPDYCYKSPRLIFWFIGLMSKERPPLTKDY